MRNSVESISDIKKNISGRRGIRAEDNITSRKNVNNNEDRSISEPPQGYSTYINHHINMGGVTRTSTRLKPIREKIHLNNDDNNQEQGSSDEDDDLSKSNSQLNESDLDIPDSVSQTPTPTPLGSGNARRINSETNLNDSKRRMTGFMGNRSKRFCASTSELSFASHLDTRKSLFSPKNNNSRALSRSSMFGSNTSLNSTNSRLFMVNSPFYNGKTMFGGASAYPKKDINQAKVLRTPIQMRPSSSLSNSSNTSTKSDGMMPESNAAKRILEVMNQFSGPLKEARTMGSNINSMIKLPGLVQNRKRFGEDELNLDRSISLSRPSVPYGRPLASTSKNRSESPLYNIAAAVTNSAAEKPLQIPTMSQLLKMKRLQNNTERVREIANRSESFLNQVHDYKLPDEVAVTSNAGGSLKMKSNITKNLLRNDKGIDQMPPAPLNLPNIQLPELKSIPKFDIPLPTSSAPSFNMNSKSITPSSPPNAPTTTMSFKTFTSIPTAKITAEDPMNDFKFASPTKLSSDFDTTKLKPVTENFSFSKPSAINSLAKVVDDSALSQKQTATSSPSLPADNLFKNLVAQQKSQWECDSCLTRNDSKENKCICCETVRPDSGISSQSSSFESIASTSSKTPVVAADDLFKNLAAKQKTSQWECDVCMCKNDLDKEKCLSCETPKPGSKKVTSTFSMGANNFKFGMPSVNDTSSSAVKPVASDDLFKSLAAQQKKTQWECDTCMTRNEVSSEKCLACETPKPGSKPAAPKSSFSFGMPPSTTVTNEKAADTEFKKLVEKQNAKWECSVCMMRNEITQSICICCEQPKPGPPDQPKFLFGSNKSSGIALPKPSEVKFTFGVQASSNKEEDQVDKPKPTFTFGATPAVSTSTSTETTPSVPSFTFKAPAPSKEDVSASFTIKSPKADEMKAAAPLKSGLISFSPNASEIKVPKKVTFEVNEKKAEEQKIETTVEKKIEPLPAFSASGFKFGGFSKPEEEKKSEDKPSGGFSFGSPATTTTTASPIASFAFGAQKIASPPQENKTFGGFGIQATNDSKPAFSFGMAKKDEPVTSISTSFTTTSTTSSAFSSPKGGFSFGSNESKPAAAVAPSTAGGFSFSSNANPTFGSSQEVPKTTSNNTMQSPSSFVFGQAKKEPEIKSTFGGFGNSQPATTTTTTQANLFGSTSNSGTFSFGGMAKEQTATASPSSVFSFGAKTSTSLAPQSTMIFGSNAASSTPNLTPVFGSNAMPTPTFGSSITANNNNNESSFGSKMVNFGSSSIPSSNQPHKRAFDFGSAQPEVPHKKFEFGSSQITQQPQIQNNSSPFQFNAQPPQQQQSASVDSRPAFNFNATAPPAFNFTANNSTNNIQENRFQLGANNTSTQGLFAFGTNPQPPQSAPVMQFGGSAPAIAIPGINAFGAQSNSANNAQSRKILRAARRTNLTRR